MKFISHILSYLFIILFVVKSALFSITTYFYVNHNEDLTALCCINKDIDLNCKSKCVLGNTKESSEQHENKTQNKSIEFFERIVYSTNQKEEKFTFRKDNFDYVFTIILGEKTRQVKPPAV